MGPVFINIDGSLVGRDQFVRMLEKSLSHIGLSGGCFVNVKKRMIVPARHYKVTHAYLQYHIHKNTCTVLH
jgi:hypothetical protein